MFLHPKIKSLLFVTVYALLASLYYYQDTHEASVRLAASSLPNTPINNFLALVGTSDTNSFTAAFAYVDQHWQESYEIMLLEVAYYSQNLDQSAQLVGLLERKTGAHYGYNFDQWFEWLWNKEQQYTSDYFEFKAQLHKRIDPKFERYFLDRAEQATIRLDEVRWGGVLQDGIPPLRNPKMLPASKANYLREGATVFGIEVNGEARAYPKQILAWHELFTDEIGGVPLAGVYCTLCGTVVLYKSKHKGVQHQLGTSGFLYRSNKLMYDKATQSLWSTLEGKPVIGPLVGKEIALEYLSVVTTSWGEWKRRHPDTQVLSLQTGYRRDYREGEAYKEYFATDDLMFTVPKVDTRLKNKDEILAIRTAEYPDKNLAISSAFLKENPIYSNRIGNIPFTVFTDDSGAHRVYKTKTLKFTAYDPNSNLAVDEYGTEWTIQENSMTSEQGEEFERFPSHNAFWFGYKAAFPDVQLIR